MGKQEFDWKLRLRHLAEEPDQEFLFRADVRACEAALREIERMEGMLRRCLPIVEDEVAMMSAITRHAPLPAEAQAKHDSTEYPCEGLLPELYRMFPDYERRIAIEVEE